MGREPLRERGPAAPAEGRRLLRTAAALGAIGAAIVAGHVWLWSVLVRDAGVRPALGRALLAVMLALGAGAPAALVVYKLVSPRAGRVIAWPTYAWSGLFFLLLVPSLGARAAVRLGADPRVAALGALAAGLASAAVAVWSALRAPPVREVRVRLPRLPARLSGFRIVQISDVHFGPTVRRAFAVDLVRRTLALAPDLVAITGDLVDGSVEDLREEVAPLASLAAPHGVYFVTGNHEYHVSADRVSGADAWLAELAGLGIRALRNERVRIADEAGGFDLAGVDDWSARGLGGGHGPDLSRALAGRDPDRELVLLAHQPRAVEEAAAHGVGLQLSGHTHGGQLWPWNHVLRLGERWVSGIFRVGPTQLYVSRGTGYWGPPMRLGAPAELTLVVLERA